MKASHYRLTVTLISPSRRLAILNGRLSKQGDRVDGAEIVSIDEEGIRLRTGSGEFTLHLGGNDLGKRATRPTVQTSPVYRSRPGLPQINLPGPGGAPAQAIGTQFDMPGRYGPVKRGETVSRIAQHYLSDGITLKQMISALYDANPQAFSGNIDALHEGAILRIPAERELHKQSTETETPEVVRRSSAPRQIDPQRARPAIPPVAGKYGPVKRGETLSGIAQQHLSGGITLNQMIMALYEANPQAFSGNINVLHEKAILRIPGANALGMRSPETATANVARQQIDWRQSRQQHARLVVVPSEGGYGPVMRGETLSGIAQRHLGEGITLDQMIIALYQANPQAFSGNINVLHEGAVLRIPDSGELRNQPAAVASAEVVRQTDAWPGRLMAARQAENITDP